MPRKTSPSHLAAQLDDRMAALGASDEEVGALIDRDPQDVREWRQGKADIDPEAAVKLRPFLAEDDSAAQAALDRIRRAFHRTWEGDHATQDTATETVGPSVRDGARYGSAGA